MKLILLAALIFSCFLTTLGERENFKPCSQSAADRNKLMDEAQRNQFTVRRVEFLGITHTPDTMVRGRMTLLNEGEVFTRQKLLRSLRRVSTLKRIHPVQLTNVEIRLERPDRIVDMSICFTERPRR
jgi:hypothetical protein